MMGDTMESNFCFVDKNRAILTLEGKDKVVFLQALTTNNVENIPKEDMVYTAILSPQGKYLFDRQKDEEQTRYNHLKYYL